MKASFLKRVQVPVWRVANSSACHMLLWVLIMGAIVYGTLPAAGIDKQLAAAEVVIASDRMPIQSASNPRWLDRTLEKGLHFMHGQGGERLAGLDEALGSGVCAADFDNDHWVDLFLVNGSGQTRHYGKRYWWQMTQGNALFHNERGQGFRNVTPKSGLEKTMWGMGCLASDLDNDGDVDLLVTGRDANLLYRNEGDGHFIEVTHDSGIRQGDWSTSAAVADINGDGLLDIYVANFIDFYKGSKTFEANSQFNGLKPATFDASLYPAQANRLYLNRGDLRFQEVSEAYGVSDKSGRTLDVSWQDVNRDGLPDLLLANASGSGSNLLYLNMAGHGFKPADPGLDWHSTSGLQGIASGDLDRDGRIDVMLGSPMAESPLVLTVSDHLAVKDLARDLGLAADHALNLSIWSPVIQDFDNDGDQDVLLASGLLEPDADAPKLPLGQGKRLLMNRGDGRFVDVGSTAGAALSDMQSARGVAAADFDNDGDIDLYVSHNNDPGQYLQNEAPTQHWIGLKLVGKRSNRDAIGAEVSIKTSQGTQVKVISSGEGFLSDSDKRLLFGLGVQTIVDAIVITWPSGLRQPVPGLVSDRYWSIEEGGAPQVLEDSQSSPHWALSLGADDANVRAAYLRLRAEHEPKADAWRELALAGQDVDAGVRLAAIEVACRFHTPAGLAILVHALDDVVTDNVLVALAGLREYEDEMSVRWLLRMFAHADARVRVAVVDMFAYFYREEEALVQRKYLAIPHLIRLLDDDQAPVRIAAARALGAAERFRGVHALQAHLNDVDPAVRAEVISALGLIRQSSVVSRLMVLLHDPAQPAEVIAEVLIALKRLGDESVMQRLEACLLARDGFQSLSLEKRVAVLRYLSVLAQDASVFDVERLRPIAYQLVAETDRNASAELVRTWGAIWLQLPDVNGQRWLKKQLHSPHAMIRLHAYRALPPSDVRQYAKQAWSDPDLSVKQWALEILLNNQAVLSNADYRLIFEQPLLRARALHIMASSDSHIQAGPWISALLNTSSLRPPKTTDPRQALERLCWTRDQLWQAFCPLLVMAEVTPLHREMAARIVFDSKLPLVMRETVLKRYDFAFDAQAVHSLYGLVAHKKDPLWRAAVEHLFSFGDDAVLGFAHQLAHDVTASAAIRFQAIAFLLRRGHAEARELLYR